MGHYTPSEARSENGHLVGLARISIQIILVELVEQGLSAPMPLRASTPDHSQDQNDTYHPHETYIILQNAQPAKQGQSPRMTEMV